MSVFLYLLLSPFTPAHGADIFLDSVSGAKGDTVTFTLSVNSAPETVHAFMIDIGYDFSVLAYRGVVPGELASPGYSLFNANNISPGLIRIAGVEPTSPGIQKGVSGVLALISFEVVGGADTDLALVSLKDDVSSWTTKGGHFSFNGSDGASGGEPEPVGSASGFGGAEEPAKEQTAQAKADTGEGDRSATYASGSGGTAGIPFSPYFRAASAKGAAAESSLSSGKDGRDIEHFNVAKNGGVGASSKLQRPGHRTQAGSVAQVAPAGKTSTVLEDGEKWGAWRGLIVGLLFAVIIIQAAVFVLLLLIFARLGSLVKILGGYSTEGLEEESSSRARHMGA